MSQVPMKRRGWGLLCVLGLLALTLLLRSDSDPVAGCLFGVVAALFLAEFTAKAVPVAKALVKAAACVLPPDDRSRFYSEWVADLEDPRHVDRPINYSLDLLIGTPRLAWELWGAVALATHDDEERRSPIGALGVISLLAAVGVGAASAAWSTVGMPLTLESRLDWAVAAGAALQALGYGGLSVVLVRRPGRRIDTRNLAVIVLLASFLQVAATGAEVLRAVSSPLAIAAAALLVGAIGAGSEIMWSIGIGRYRPRDAVVLGLTLWSAFTGVDWAMDGMSNNLLLGAGAGAGVAALATVGILSLLGRAGVIKWLLVPEFDECLVEDMAPGGRGRAMLFSAWTPEFHRPALMLNARSLPFGPITAPRQVELIQQMVAGVPMLPRTRSSFFGALVCVSGIDSLRRALREHFGNTEDPEVARLVEKYLQ